MQLDNAAISQAQSQILQIPPEPPDPDLPEIVRPDRQSGVPGGSLPRYALPRGPRGRGVLAPVQGFARARANRFGDRAREIAPHRPLKTPRRPDPVDVIVISFHKRDRYA